MAPKLEDKGSQELHYLDENGNKQDTELHEEFFADGAEEVDSAEVYQRMLDEGMDPELAESLYG